MSTLAAAAVAVLVGGYSLWQVRAGRWSHVDASQPTERQNLHRFLLALLLGGAWLATASGQPRVLAAGLLACAAIVLVAVALRRWGKTSLHCAFASFGATLAWPVWAALVPVAALALGVGWSRLRLGRHSLSEVLGGLLLGAIVGAVFQGVLRS